MGSEIIRVSPDEDLYFEWSSIVDAPTFVGTRAELLAHLYRSYRPVETPEQRISRADITGTSAMHHAAGHHWGVDGIMYQQDGILPRAKLGEYARRLRADVNAEPTGLLEPFADDEPVEAVE